ncbi:hypothetical protein BGI08_03255 [Snodgrassella alvi]|nr:hypothetical protein BGI08_03255 [Snodgrassella alvi]
MTEIVQISLHKKLSRNFLILFVSYFIFILCSVGALLFYFYDECERSGASFFLGLIALINFFVFLFSIVIKALKAIFSRTENKQSLSFKFLLFNFTLFLITFFISILGYRLLSTYYNQTDIVLLNILCCSFCIFICFLILFFAKIIKWLFLRSA